MHILFLQGLFMLRHQLDCNIKFPECLPCGRDPLYPRMTISPYLTMEVVDEPPDDAEGPGRVGEEGVVPFVLPCDVSIGSILLLRIRFWHWSVQTLGPKQKFHHMWNTKWISILSLVKWTWLATCQCNLQIIHDEFFSLIFIYINLHWKGSLVLGVKIRDVIIKKIKENPFKIKKILERVHLPYQLIITTVLLCTSIFKGSSWQIPSSFFRTVDSTPSFKHNSSFNLF